MRAGFLFFFFFFFFWVGGGHSRISDIPRDIELDAINELDHGLLKLGVVSSHLRQFLCCLIYPLGSGFEVFFDGGHDLVPGDVAGEVEDGHDVVV